jgi:hypothetical protein
MFCLFYYLVGVREAAHSGGDAKDVVGHGVHEQLALVGFLGETLEVQGHVVEAGEVAGTGRLVGLGVQSERVAVDVLVGHASVVLVGLHQTEVRRLALGETVVAVELQLGGRERLVRGRGEWEVHHVPCNVTVIVSDNVATNVSRHVAELEHLGVRGAAHGPHELLHGVVEVQAHLVGLGGLHAGVLELLDEVLVGHLGETLTLLGVEVHVVHVQLHTVEILHFLVGCSTIRIQLFAVAELDVELHLVVLKGDQGERQTRVTAEEELQGDEKLVRLQRGSGAVRVAATDHLLETVTLLLGEGELGPDLEPLTVMLVDALTADLELHVLNQGVAHRVHVLMIVISVLLRKGHLEPHVGHEIAVAADGAGHAGTGLGGAVEGLLDGLHGEVGVAAVHHLEERDLGLTGQVNVLSADGDELH